ncbi:hypothetical protein [Dyella japonica]|uniref:DUF4124 domain-containing protein n=1 Tax=Dyella japonica A8 TaxID=1217721 RepID=A0A075JXM7_9GAMM|nr:hypothetical protein [Dyella japonica]AIF46619.1 hypothetical protein HY57_04740 [Dyella japonica A8]
MPLLDSRWAKGLAGALPLLALLVPGHARADIYKCVKAGAVAYQETPCEGSNVQSTHIEDRDANHFVGCFAVIERQYAHYYEVRANGAGTYQLIDERNPFGQTTLLKQATGEELAALSDGLHIKVTGGLSRYNPQMRTMGYGGRYGNRYGTMPAQQISSYDLYGVYKATGASGRPMTLLYSGGSVPQTLAKSDCPNTY